MNNAIDQTDQLLNEALNESLKQPPNQSSSSPLNQSFKKILNRPLREALNRAFRFSVKHAVLHSANPSGIGPTRLPLESTSKYNGTCHLESGERKMRIGSRESELASSSDSADCRFSILSSETIHCYSEGFNTVLISDFRFFLRRQYTSTRKYSAQC